MAELKPCPFCGGAAELIKREYTMIGHKEQAEDKIAKRAELKERYAE